MKLANCLKLVLLGVAAGCHAQLLGQIDPNVKPSADQPKPVRIGEFHSFVADNGMKVFLVRRADYPKFRLSIDANLPTVFDEQQPEVRDILGGLMASGNRKYDAAEIKRVEKFYAATISVSPRTLVCAGMREYADRLMPIAAAYYTAPRFDAGLLDSLVGAKVAALADKQEPRPKSRSDNFMGYLMDSLRFAREVDPKTPKEETAEGFRQVDLAAVKAYFNRYVNPRNASCMLIGDFTVDEANRFINRYFKGWKKGPSSESKPFKKEYETRYPDARRIYVVDKPGAVQSRIVVSRPLGDAYPYGDNEPVLEIMNQVYGAGYMSNLNKNIRLDKGLSYGANNNLGLDVTGGSCSTIVMVQTASTAYALENILFEMLRMRNELPSEQDFEIALNGKVGEYARSMSQLNSPAIIGFGLLREQYGLSDDYLARYADRLQSITRKDVRDAARKYINPFKCYIYITGNAEALRGTLEQFGTVEYYDSLGNRLQ